MKQKMHFFSVVDIGTYQVKTLIAQKINKDQIAVLGAGVADTEGMQFGVVSNIDALSKSIRNSVLAAEKTANRKIGDVFLAVNNYGMIGTITHSEVATSRSDLQITEMDLEKLKQVSQDKLYSLHKKDLDNDIVWQTPISYKIDGELNYSDPLDMLGNKIEADTLFITSRKKHTDDFIRATERAGLSVLEILPSPIAMSCIPQISRVSMRAGAALVNIGYETTTIMLYQNEIPISFEIFKIGSNDITNDIAVNLKVSPEEAEKIKLGEVKKFNNPILDNIIRNRVIQILDLIEKHITKYLGHHYLPGGLIITGGGSKITNLDSIVRTNLQLPVSIIIPSTTSKVSIKDQKWSVVYGLCYYCLFLPQRKSGASLWHKFWFGVQKLFHKITP